MTEDFCNRTARRLGKIGYAPKVAVRIARFCYVSMLSVSGMMGAMLHPSMKSMAGEEDERLLRLPIAVPFQASYSCITGSGKFSLGARAGTISPVSFSIPR